MSELPAKLKPLSGYEDLNLEEILVAMCYLGEPRMHKFARGWHCSCDMHVSSKGAKFEVCSEFNHATPREAALECVGRLIETVKQYS